MGARTRARIAQVADPAPPGTDLSAPLTIRLVPNGPVHCAGPLAPRGVDIRALKYGDVEKVSGNKVKQAITVREGVEQELAKKIVRVIKDSKMKVQASIQGEAVRVSGAKRDELQDTIALVEKSITDFPLQYQNFRD